MYVNVDIELDDILTELTSREKQQLADDLYEDGYCPSQVDQDSINEKYSDFDKQVQKLIGNSWRLTKEDEETILKITNKLI
jgi:hypothetical protein